MGWLRIAGLALFAGTLIIAQVKPSSAQSIGILQATLGETGTKTSEVSTQDMRNIVADGSAIIIDSRSQKEFDAGHIPGAQAVTGADQLAAVARLTNGDKARALVLYCNGPFCQASRRLADQLADFGYSNVRRYQLGMPIWRALGGPTALERDGLARIAASDKSAVFIDARPARDFANGSFPGAHSAPLEDVLSGKLQKINLPEDDFNRRVVLFGRDGMEARKLAEVLSKRPWHNIAYFTGAYEALAGLN